MAEKKPETPGFSNTELRDAVLELLDTGSTQDFNAAFAIVMHARGIFHHQNKETYNFWFRRIGPLVKTALNARKLKTQRAANPQGTRVPAKKLEIVTPSFAKLFRQGYLSEFTPEPAE